MSIDLHVHSLFSDGTYTPYELVRMAKRNGLTAISITDHDTLSGTAQAIEAGKKFDIDVVSGIELSVNHRDIYMHFLGYFIDYTSKELRTKIAKLQTAREARNAKIIKNINDLGMLVTPDEVQVQSQVGQTGRPHIAKVLFSKGYVKSMNSAFEKYLKKGASAYESRFIYSAAEAINIIKNAGGLIVLAHPVQVDRTLVRLPKIIEELVNLGLDGVELYYPTHTKKIRKRIRKITDKHDLLFTGGSDYHGEIRPGTSLACGNNVHVPAELLEVMKKRRNVR